MERACSPTEIRGMVRRIAWWAALVVAVAGGVAAWAGEIGHFSPGVPNIRDYVMPDPGFYCMVYSYKYSSDRINDRHGDEINSVTGPGGQLKLSVDVDLDFYVVAPGLIWVSPWEILGARYGAYVMPTFATSSMEAALTTLSGRGGSLNASSEFGAGDLYVQPLWLDWSFKHWDLALGYGVYAPVGRYDTQTVTLPVVGPVTVENEDNIGYGFWTQQAQCAASWYPWENKGTAVATALTYEVHGEKEDYDLTPGDNLTFNWGVSQYVPLTTDKRLLLEVGPAGYDSWQTTDDSGHDARNPDVHDQVHAAGAQVGLTYVPWQTALNVHYFYEYAARDRFQGQSLGVNLAVKF
jgi:hypothetical protein